MQQITNGPREPKLAVTVDYGSIERVNSDLLDPVLGKVQELFFNMGVELEWRAPPADGFVPGEHVELTYLSVKDFLMRVPPEDGDPIPHLKWAHVETHNGTCVISELVFSYGVHSLVAATAHELGHLTGLIHETVDEDMESVFRCQENPYLTDKYSSNLMDPYEPDPNRPIYFNSLQARMVQSFLSRGNVYEEFKVSDFNLHKYTRLQRNLLERA